MPAPAEAAVLRRIDNYTRTSRISRAEISDLFYRIEQYFILPCFGGITFAMNVTTIGNVTWEKVLTTGLDICLVEGCKATADDPQFRLIYFYRIVPACASFACCFLVNYGQHSPWPLSGSSYRLYDFLRPFTSLMEFRGPGTGPPPPGFHVNLELSLLYRLLYGAPAASVRDRDALMDELRMDTVPRASLHSHFHAAVTYLLAKCGLFVVIRKTFAGHDFDTVSADLFELCLPYFADEYRARSAEYLRKELPVRIATDPRFLTPLGLRMLKVCDDFSANGPLEGYFFECHVNALIAVLARPAGRDLFISNLDELLAHKKMPESLTQSLSVLFEELITKSAESPKLAPSVRSVASVLIAREKMTVTEVFDKIAKNPVVFDQCFAFLYDSVPDLFTTIRQFPVNQESAALYLNALSSLKNVPDASDVIKQLILLDDPEVNNALLAQHSLVNQYRSEILEIVWEVDEIVSDVAFLIKIVGKLNVDCFEFKASMFFKLTSLELVNLFQSCPFLVISNVELLFEFVPHDAQFFRLVEEKCLDRVSEVTDELLALDDRSPEFVSLLLRAFRATGNRVFLWKALAADLLPDACFVQEFLTAVNQMEILNSIASGYLLQQLLKLDLSSISFAGFDYKGRNWHVDQLSFLLVRGCELDVEGLLHVLKASSSAIARECALDRLLGAGWRPMAEILADVLRFGCERNSEALVAKILSLKIITFDMTILADCFSGGNEAVSRLLFDFVKDDFATEKFVNANNFLILESVLSADQKIELVRSARSPEEIELYLSKIDPSLAAKVWSVFFDSEFPADLRTPRTISKLFEFMSKSLEAFIENANEVTPAKSCLIRPTSDSVFLPVLANLSSVFLSETGETRKALQQLRYGSSPSCVSPSQYDTFNFGDIIGVLSPESVEKFIWLIAKKGVCESHPSLFLNDSVSIVKSLSKLLAQRSVIHVPEIVVLEFIGIDASRIEINESLTICGSKYRLNSVICALTLAYVIGDTMLKYERNKVSLADRIEGSLSYLFYEKCEWVPQLRALSAGDTASVIIAHSLQCESIDWSLFEPTSEFLSAAVHLIGKFLIPGLFNRFAQNPDFSTVFFEQAIDYADVFQTLHQQVCDLIKVNPNPVACLLEMIDNVDEEHRHLVDIVLEFVVLLQISGDDLVICENLICEQSSFRRSPKFPQFLSYLLFDSGLDATDFFDSLAGAREELLEIAVKLGDARLKRLILPLNTKDLPIILNGSSVDFLVDLLHEEPDNIELAIQGVLNFSADLPVFEHFARFQQNPQLRENHRWLAGLLQCGSKEIRNRALELMPVVWPPDETVDPNIAKILLATVNRDNIVHFYQLIDKYSK
jgi:hypothetical protein